MPSRCAPPTGASLARRPAGGREIVAAARACPPGTVMAAGARCTGGTRWCGGAFCLVTALSRAKGRRRTTLGGGTLQARPGPRLLSRLASTSLRGGRAPGSHARPRRARPAAGGGGVFASPGVRAWLSVPCPPCPYRARRHPPRPVLPLPVRATGLAAPWLAPAALPPPLPRVCPGGRGCPAWPPRGGEGGGWRPPALRPGRALGAAIPYSASPVLTPTLFLPPVARAGRCPHVAGPQRHWQREAQAGSRAGTSRCIDFVSLAVRSAGGGGRRFLVPAQIWASRVLLGHL